MGVKAFGSKLLSIYVWKSNNINTARVGPCKHPVDFKRASTTKPRIIYAIWTDCDIQFN